MGTLRLAQVHVRVRGHDRERRAGIRSLGARELPAAEDPLRHAVPLAAPAASAAERQVVVAYQCEDVAAVPGRAAALEFQVPAVQRVREVRRARAVRARSVVDRFRERVVDAPEQSAPATLPPRNVGGIVVRVRPGVIEVDGVPIRIRPQRLGVLGEPSRLRAVS